MWKRKKWGKNELMILKTEILCVWISGKAPDKWKEKVDFSTFSFPMRIEEGH